MTEGTGWASRLRRVVNARMEELSVVSRLVMAGYSLAVLGVVSERA